jgi:hypothetical protein
MDLAQGVGDRPFGRIFHQNFVSTLKWGGGGLFDPPDPIGYMGVKSSQSKPPVGTERSKYLRNKFVSMC